MRSSIACIRCRRSKVKCVNSGVGTTCRSCENSGRECSYPSPVTGASRRRDSFSGRPEGAGAGAGEGERRQRPRKSAPGLVNHIPSSSRESPRPLLDALDPRLLTPSVWQELFDIFQVHYSADLPFLHPPTFLKPLRPANMYPSSATPTSANAAARPPASPDFLLAFLALTARFHPKLVAHHSPSSASHATSPLVASEYYATAANERLASTWTEHRPLDLERTQATLMLGLHEWGMRRGAKAWLTVGVAIRAAQALGLQYEPDLDDAPLSCAWAVSGDAEPGAGKAERTAVADASKMDEDHFIQQEIRRRTFWSCYILDRYLSSGKYRPQMLGARALRIQLPASERSFLFAEKVRTLMLGEANQHVDGRAKVQDHRQRAVMLGSGAGTPSGPGAATTGATPLRPHESDEEKGRLEVGADEGLVSRYVQILEIYGQVVEWSCGGGRRVEEHPPWDPRCGWNVLQRQCLDFKAGLPRQNALTPQNTQAHISLKTSTPYTLVHVVYLLCQIMLNREYLPFIPVRSSKPDGPAGPPLFPRDRFDVPAGFWEDGARECVRSAREIVGLLQSCQEWSALVETPVIGFAIYMVAFLGVYCINFPWMDPDGYLCTPPSSVSHLKSGANRPGESKGFEAARKSLEMLGQVRARVPMAGGWFETINRLHRYYRRVKGDSLKHAPLPDSSSAEHADPPAWTHVRKAHDAGARDVSEESKLFERTLHEIGEPDDPDIDMTDAGPRLDPRGSDAAYDGSSAGSSVKSEEPDPRGAAAEPPPRADNGPWNAINSVPGSIAGRHHPSRPTPSSGQFRSYDSYLYAPAANQAEEPPPGPAAAHTEQNSSAPPAHGFRPTHASDPPAPAGEALGLASSASHSALAASQTSPSSHEPPRSPASHSWPAPPASHPMAPPAYSNGVSSSSSPHGPRPGAPAAAAAAAAAADPMREVAFDPLTAPLGGDDVAAFVDGGDVVAWARLAAAKRGFAARGWLGELWAAAGAGS